MPACLLNTTQMIQRFVLILISLVLVGCHATYRTHHARRNTGPWNIPDLQRAPNFTFGSKTGAVQEVYYEGEPFEQKPTRVFAYLGRPRQAHASGSFPAAVLVHGGGGRAFKDWAEHW